MKKIFLMFAAAAMLTACTGNANTDTTAGATDSAAVEETTEEAEEAVVEKMGPCSIESEDLSLDVPEGWKATVGHFEEIIMTKEREDHMTQKIEVSKVPHKTAAVRIDDLVSTGIKKGADVKIGGKTYATTRSESNEFYHLVADWGEEIILDVTINFIQPEDPTVKAVVESVKLKDQQENP